MDINKINPGIRDRVAAEMVAAEVSKRSLAISSGVPLTTLDRKLKGTSDFTAREVAMLANALGVSFVSLLPDELQAGTGESSSRRVKEDAAA